MHADLYDENGQLEIGPTRLTIAEEEDGWHYLVAETHDDNRVALFSGRADGGREAAATTALALYRAEMLARATRAVGELP